jgi:tyrosyl-tRNA synthetase
MSKSLPGSGIAVTDSYEEIKKTIRHAYCPEKEVKDNPILQIARLIIFPRIDVFRIERPEKYGGNVEFKDYAELEKKYASGEIYPLDLKNAVTEYLEKIIAPIRAGWKK